MGYVQNPRVKWLLTRSYGQGGTVALPSSRGQDRLNVLADFPAGVFDVLNQMEKCYTSWPSEKAINRPIEWCFLIGGPGNGKSEALRFLANTLGIELPTRARGQSAPRTVPRDWPGTAGSIPNTSDLEIVFINDASIPRPDALDTSRPGSLFLDIADGIDRLFDNGTPVIVFANVNRGVLVEEQARLTRVHPDQSKSSLLATEIINWLVDTPEEDSSNIPFEILQTTSYLNRRKPYYAQFAAQLTAHGASHNVIAHVVFLDALSLLEPTPGPVGRSIEFPNDGRQPILSDYTPLGRLSNRGGQRDQTVAGKLLLDYLVQSNEWEEGGCVSPSTSLLCEAIDVCPFAQNARWLRQVGLAHRFLDLLRAVEISASRRLTYRDLLGHFSLALIGQPEESWLKDQHPCHWIEEKNRALSDVNNQSNKSAVGKLVGHRLYSSIFPPVDADRWKQLAERPLTGDSLYKVALYQATTYKESSRARAYDMALNTLDPARDVEPWDGLRHRTLEAIESLDIEYPSHSISRNGVIPPEATTRLETLLDQVIQGEIESELSRNLGPASTAALNRVKLLRKWRCSLLLRQVGMATGNFSFKKVVSLWLAEQENALVGGDPRELGQGIRLLVLPQQQRGTLLLAPLRPRTYSLVRGDLPTNTLLVSVSLRDLWVDIIPEGDILTAVVTRGREQTPIASLVIDLAIAREAALQANSEHGSFTEIGASAFARIERVRASLVSRSRLSRSTTFFTDSVGDLYSIRRNPIGTAPLSIERESL